MDDRPIIVSVGLPVAPLPSEPPAAPPSPAPPPPAGARPAPQYEYQRQVLRPLLLFLATCVTTFWAGVAGMDAPMLFLDFPRAMQLLAQQWPSGLVYMAAAMGILLAHEMGHFVLAYVHRVPASWPFFLPVPGSPFGTFGAVIGMQGSRANRLQLFDIGIAGPIAGLVVAIPVTLYGILIAKPVIDPTKSSMVFQDPLLVEMLIRWLRPEVSTGELYMNPLLMAGWIGMLVTGLNMMPIGQLDGGHIAYALLGRKAYWLARAVVLAAVVFMVNTGVYNWALMLVLIIWMGIHHPLTADDRVPLGPVRTCLGYASLAIPILCFPPWGFY